MPEARFAAMPLSMELEKSEERYRNLAESLPQMVWTADQYGQVNYANARCLSYSGMSSSQKFGEGWVHSIYPEDIEKVTQAWIHSMRTGTEFNEEYRLRRKDGEFRWFVGRAIPAKDKKGSIQYWIGTATDIEDQKQAIEKLETERALREQFVATLTHDLRNPLTSAKMSAQLISRLGHEPEKLASLTGRIIDSITRANRMIENLLDANRIKAGEALKLEMSSLDLCSLVNEVVAELTTVLGARFAIKENNSAINGLWCEDALRRILENLCSNAVKYGAEHKPVTISLSEDSSDASITVHNVGNPIAPGELAKLFEPYKRVSTTANSTKKGWGLGLTLVKGLVDAHGGKLSVTSSPEDGTAFKVTLPKKS